LSLENSRNEIYKRMGENIMLFQKIESILKYINHFKKTASYVSKLKENNKILINNLNSNTMGQLLNEYLILQENKSTHNIDTSKEPFISFHLELSPSYLENKSKLLKTLLEERNDLVHHSYLNFNVNSVESCIEIIKTLDEQKKRVKLEINDLRTIVAIIEDFKKALIHTLKSDEFKKGMYLCWLQNSELVIVIVDKFNQIARADGWASLSRLGQVIRKTCSKEMKLLKTKYKCKSLKQLLIETELFELREEKKENNSSILYRIKPNFKIEK